MKFEAHSSYKAFSETIKTSVKNKTNVLVLSVPGMSVTFYIKKFLENESGNTFKYISDEGQDLYNFNFLDLNFNLNPKALEIASDYFRKSALNQKFCLVINTPYTLDTNDFKSSGIGSHIYKTYYFKVLDKDLIKTFASILKVKVTNGEIERVYKLSGGLTRIVKFLITNEKAIDFSPAKVLQIPDFKRILEPTFNVVEKCSENTLFAMGIKNEKGFVGEILREYFKNAQPLINLQIKINADLTFSENGITSKNRLLKLEKEIVEAAIANNGVVTKEKVADLKWEEGSYDRYSDQAIAKTMQRLEKKLSKYKIEVIPKYGYKIVAS